MAISFKSLIKSQLPFVKVTKAKRIILKVQIPANNASITPPLGTLLGQYGVNIMDFCKDFNSKTLHIEKDIMINVIIFIETDKSFSFIVKLPTISYFFKQYLNNLFELNQDLIYFDFLIFVYDLALLHFTFYNKSITEKKLQNYICCILGTFRSFKIKFPKYELEEIDSI